MRALVVAGRRTVALAVTALVLSSLLLATGERAAFAGSPISGAGSTFAQIAIEQWQKDAANQLGLTVDYQPNGSSTGRQFFSSGLVDFASSDIPFEANESPGPRGYTYLPLVAGGTALMFNLRDTADRPIRDLKLDGPTIAKIFFREIQYWDDAAILEQNPTLATRIVAGSEIRPVARSGGSGTTAVFTGYLANVAPDSWSRFADTYDIPGSFTSNFPSVSGVILQQGSDGIANFVASPNQGRGSIGYAEAAFAIQAGLPVVAVKNAAGNHTYPTAYNVAVALFAATRNGDGTQNLDGVYFNNRPPVYPISSYNYLIVPTDGLDPSKGETLGAFIVYSVTAGQAKAADLGYSPLPPNLVEQSLQQVTRIVGAAAPPPLGDWGRYYEALIPPPSGTTTTTTRPGTTTTTRASTGTTSTSSATGNVTTTSGSGSVSSTSSQPGGSATPSTDPRTGTVIDPPTGSGGSRSPSAGGGSRTPATGGSGTVDRAGDESDGAAADFGASPDGSPIDDGVIGGSGEDVFGSGTDVFGGGSLDGGAPDAVGVRFLFDADGRLRRVDPGSDTFDGEPVGFARDLPSTTRLYALVAVASLVILVPPFVAAQRRRRRS
jgi:phosphate transport system substrate-binding protein